jgi:hypothetical protein
VDIRIEDGTIMGREEIYLQVEASSWVVTVEHDDVTLPELATMLNDLAASAGNPIGDLVATGWYRVNRVHHYPCMTAVLLAREAN